MQSVQVHSSSALTKKSSNKLLLKSKLWKKNKELNCFLLIAPFKTVPHTEMSQDIKHVTKVYNEFKYSSTKVESLCTELHSRRSDLCIVRPGCLTGLQPSGCLSRGKIQLQEGLFFTQQQLLFYQLRKKKASSWIMRQRLTGSKGKERNTDKPNANVTAAVLGSLEKELPT